jgi:hypothetical protein
MHSRFKVPFVVVAEYLLRENKIATTYELPSRFIYAKPRTGEFHFVVSVSRVNNEPCFKIVYQ